MLPFRLFDLPRELRDHVYSHLITPIKEIAPENSSEVFDKTPQYTLDAPIPPLLRVNRKFSSEYADVLPKHRKLIIIGDTSDNFTCFPQNRPAFTNLIEHLTIYIHVECYCDHMDASERREFFEETGAQCDGADFLEFYQSRISELLLQFSNLQTLDVKLGLWGAEDKPIEWPLTTHTPEFSSALEALLGLTALRRLDVVKCSSQDDYWHYTRESVWRWENKKTGKAEYRLGRGKHQLATFAKWTRESAWEGGNGRKTLFAWDSSL